MTKTQRIAQFRACVKNVSVVTTIGLLICTLATIGLFVASFIVPPTGEIHSSVLAAGGWISALATLWELREAIREGLGFKITHGQTTVEVKDQDGAGAPEETTITTDNDEEV